MARGGTQHGRRTADAEHCRAEHRGSTSGHEHRPAADEAQHERAGLHHRSRSHACHADREDWRRDRGEPGLRVHNAALQPVARTLRDARTAVCIRHAQPSCAVGREHGGGKVSGEMDGQLVARCLSDTRPQPRALSGGCRLRGASCSGHRL